ncbi:MAG TPA: choice-of-anchor Q domain-containing protein [Dissulfurispiraceae bacterium]|nr:choice-of-anchor Q domain-containing protein [Dissulfurispiraceae bacterium]
MLFKRSCKWRGQLFVWSNGDSGNPITYGNYGIGDNPIFDGSVPVTGWTAAVGSDLVYSSLLITNPAMVFFNDKLGIPVASKDDLTSDGQYYWENNTLYVYSSADPNLKTIEASTIGAHQGLITAWSRSNIVVDGIYVRRSAGSGYKFDGTNGASNIELKNFKSDYSLYWGVLLFKTTHANVHDGEIAHAATGSYLTNGKAYGEGLRIDSGSYNKVWNTEGHNIWNIGLDLINRAHDNEIFGNVWHEISIPNNHAACFYSDNATRNYWHSNTAYNCDVGMSIASETAGSASDYNTISYNLIYNNSQTGLFTGGVGGSSHNYYLNNTIYGNHAWSELLVNPTSSFETFKNNIFVETGNNPFGFQGTTGHILDYNLYYRTDNSDLIFDWNGIKNFADFKTADGGDTHSLRTNPMFIDPANGNFRLRAGSPAINAGINVGLTSDFDGKTVPNASAPDIGAFEDSGSVRPSPPSELVAY